MKSWTTWLACLGMAGACAAWSGCGEDDVPDPESDPHAATESSAGAEPRPIPAAAQNEQSAPVAAPAETTKAASAPSEAPRNDQAAKTAEPAATEAEKPKSDGSATAERLAQAGTTTPSDGGGTPGTGGASHSSSGGYPGGPGGPPAGGPGMPGGPGGPGGADTGPAEFRTQRGAVKAFLAAVRARDPARLKEATALRAPTESRPHHQKFFEAVLAETLAPDDIDDLAKKLEGFQIADANIPHSTAKRGIILRKAGGNGAFLQRTITVRKEKAGWKVVDISGEGKLEKPIVMPTMPGFGMPSRHH